MLTPSKIVGSLVVVLLAAVEFTCCAEEIHKFPFSVEVDEKAGVTGAFPNRIRHRDVGMWFAFVPAGRYQIGSDDKKDSKNIEVVLSPFYISETQVSYETFWISMQQHIEEQVKSALSSTESPPTKLSERDVRNVLLMMAYSWDSVFNDWSDLNSIPEIQRLQKKIRDLDYRWRAPQKLIHVL